MERAKISLGAAAILSLIYQLHYTCIRFFAIFIMSIAIKHMILIISGSLCSMYLFDWIELLLLLLLLVFNLMAFL